MPIQGELYPINEKNLSSAPDSGGVYALYVGNDLIYYGRSKGGTTSIRSRLNDHASGRDGKCTQQATHYRREVTASATSREVALLEDFKRATGRLPRCNERVG